jgi:hypothetical protein
MKMYMPVSFGNKLVSRFMTGSYKRCVRFLQDDFFGAPDITAPKTAKDKKTAESAKAVADDLDDIRIGQGAEVVTITRDVAGMSQDEKLGVWVIQPITAWSFFSSPIVGGGGGWWGKCHNCECV